ncbi:MAG: rhomboid family intramembrane serine protease [Deferrisomatales bacterium]|nr:rhomboid family intramembrane serine protease [Deferrisomatales bacterium]
MSGAPPPPQPDGWEEALPFPDAPGAARGKAAVWSLVLQARGVPHRFDSRGGRTALLVPPAQRPRAEEEIRLYEAENRFWPPTRPPEPPTVRNDLRTYAVLVALGLFHDLTFQAPGRVLGIAVDWHRVGRLDAARVLEGEWWRLATALTLHGDGLHLAGNLLLGGLLLVHWNRQMGVGLGMALVLASGILGNLTNALVRPPAHLSVGSSTAVFGALGLLVGRAAGLGLGRDWRRWVLPLGAAGGVLALTGVGGERTDYLAHLFGLGWGIVGGLLTAWPRPLRGVPGRRVSGLAGLAALAALVGAWALALGQG